MRTGLPVVIDAAAAFDSLKVGQTPAVVSLHATKVLGVGESGFVVSRNTAIIHGVKQRSNFGFYGGRSADVPALNVKLSEYHAAVGLAALDMWSEIRAEWMSVAGCYRRALEKSNHINLQPGFGEDWVSSTCVVSVEERSHAELQSVLAAAGIDTRMWWGRGMHKEKATAAYPRSLLPVTTALAESTLGLPIYRDLQKDEVDHIVASLAAALRPAQE